MLLVLYGFQAFLLYVVNYTVETNEAFIRLNIVSNVIYYGGMFALMIIPFRGFWYKQIRHLRDNYKLIFKAIIIGFGSMLAVSSIAALILTYLGITDTSVNQATLNEFVVEGQLLDHILFVVFAVVLAPVVEEIVFRKGIFDVLEKYNIHPIIIIATSSIIFGLVHVLGDDIVQILSYALLGGVLGSVYYLTKKNIFSSIIIHSVFNLMVTISMFSIIYA
jgi:hypothetical protein